MDSDPETEKWRSRARLIAYVDFGLATLFFVGLVLIFYYYFGFKDALFIFVIGTLEYIIALLVIYLIYASSGHELMRENISAAVCYAQVYLGLAIVAAVLELGSIGGSFSNPEEGEKDLRYTTGWYLQLGLKVAQYFWDCIKIYIAFKWSTILKRLSTAVLMVGIMPPVVLAPLPPPTQVPSTVTQAQP